MRRLRLAALSAILIVTTLVAPVAIAERAGASGPAAPAAGPPTYVVTIENLTQGQYLTPPNWAAHDNSAGIFKLGDAASAGVQAVAENGGVPVLAAELAESIDAAGLGVSGVGAEAPIEPGGSATFEFTSGESRFSLAAMLICTNDGFAGLDSVKLPARDGQTRTYSVRAYDAGTEINSELVADLVPAPFCGGDGAGTGESNPELAENGVIKRHRTIRGVGDLDSTFDWRGRVAKVTITRVDPDPTYTVTIYNRTSGQYLTPPNWAAHAKTTRIFKPGQAASAGLQAVAENGGVPVLAAELAESIDAAGLGVSGVGAEAPIEPGGSATFEFTSGESRFSLAAMLICTNDGFAGLDSRQLPTRDGQTRTYSVRAYDAGTEINTELVADLVPAPFCGGNGAGTGESNPELAENGVIKRHRTIRGVGDLDSTFDWNGSVAEVVITRNAAVAEYTVVIENLTTGQYITPPNWAAHSPAARIFKMGQAASAGVQAVAENGGVPVLAAELAESIDAAGLGVSGVGAEAPIEPGGSTTFQFTSNRTRFSVAAMLICTNDGFAGLDSRKLPTHSGQTRTYMVGALDAGTEINTELVADLVPAPFCGGDGAGTGESNPELAENGVIKRHRTIRGVGDLDSSFDWNGNVVMVTITRN